jgi:hypothetical protein
MNDGIHKLSLHQPMTYQIKVPGQLDDSWLDSGGELRIVVETEADYPPVTILTVTFDQAGLHGLLRRLYSLGLPLISVIYVEGDSEDKSGNQDGT